MMTIFGRLWHWLAALWHGHWAAWHDMRFGIHAAGQRHHMAAWRRMRARLTGRGE